jgi:hypothetical protein
MALQDVADCPWGDTSFHVLGQGPSPSNNPASLPPDVDKELDLVEAAAAAAANADLDGVLPLISLSGPTMAQKTSNLSDHLQYVCDLIQLSSLPRRFSRFVGPLHPFHSISLLPPDRIKTPQAYR